MRYRVVHKTDYTYAQPIALGHNETHLRPRSFESQRCLSHQLEIEPQPELFSEREDFFGNPVSYFSIQHSHSRLSVTATSQVELQERVRPAAGAASSSWEGTAARLARECTSEVLDARPYVLDSPLVSPSAEIARYAAVFFPPGRPLIEAVRELMERIHRDFVYDPGSTMVATPLSVVFEHRRGVCQDFAHLAIACLRSQGLAARYVSGYLETFPPPGWDKLIGADASHAWFSVYDPVLGWLDFDPTNNQTPADRHITVAWGRDYSDITPLKGMIYSGGHHQAVVSVEVTNLTAS